MTGLAFTDAPCLACGAKETIGVAYGAPEEVKFWCPECLPDEFRSAIRSRSDQEMIDAWNEIEQGRDRKRWAEEAKLRENGDG